MLVLLTQNTEFLNSINTEDNGELLLNDELVEKLIESLQLILDNHEEFYSRISNSVFVDSIQSIYQDKLVNLQSVYYDFREELTNGIPEDVANEIIAHPEKVRPWS